MELLYSSVVLFISLVVVWIAGYFTVRYAVRIAYLLHVSPLFIGFPIISLLTGLPELMIAVYSLIIGQPIVSAGDIIGSNFIDVALALGIAACFIGPINSNEQENQRHNALIVLSFLLMSGLFIVNRLNFTIGIILLLVYVICIVWFWRTRHATKFNPDPELIALSENPHVGYIKVVTILKLLFALLCIMLAAGLSVQSALAIANAFGISAGIIGATIIAVGTSLPELSIVCTAVYNKQYSLAIGTSLGSALEQGTLILGILGFFTPKTIDLQPFSLLAPFLLLSYVLVAYGLIRHKRISRTMGFFLILIYGAYLIAQFFWR